jgi:IclR family KDG regulon transcriptional repressor
MRPAGECKKVLTITKWDYTHNALRNSVLECETMYAYKLKTRPSQKKLRPNNLVQTIERVTSILDTLGQHPQGLSLGELSGRIEFPKGTTHRLVSSLAYFDYVRQDPLTKNYFLGFKLVDLGNLMLDQLDLRNEARPHLIHLAENVQETVHLVIRDTDEVLYIDKVDLYPRRAGLQMVSRLGARTPMHCCSVGKVLLADLPAEEFETIIRSRGLPQKTRNTITDRDRLREHLAQVRATGYAVDDEENEEGVRCVAAPIRNKEGRIIAAMSISGPTARLPLEHIQTTLKDEVCKTALNISRQLGFKDG